jgi:4-carboxymuconolactone decarboxylase
MTASHLRFAILAAALAAGISSVAVPAWAQTRPDQPIPTPEAYKALLPPDVHPETGNRFPKAKREELDDLGKKMFDALPASARGGPSSVRIFSPQVAEAMRMENDYLRQESGMDPQIKELAILVTVREMDSQYIWTSHEPQARAAGVSQEVIEAVKHRRPLTGFGEKETVVIQLGREAVGANKVSSETFSRALKLLGRQGLVNVIALMGNYAANAILLNTVDQQMDPGVTPRLPIP